MFGYYEDGEAIRARTFDPITEQMIAEKFVAAWAKSNPSHLGEDDEAWSAALEFVTGLETHADPEHLVLDRLTDFNHSPQRRREKLTAVANALDDLRVALGKVYMLDLLPALEAGFIEAERSIPPQYRTSTTTPWQSAIKVHLARLPNPSGGHGELGRFINGLRQYIAETKPPSLAQPVRLGFALEIVRFLDKHNIPASTSSTGLAGFAFEATFELAGLPAPKAGYWIAKAKRAFAAEKAADSKQPI
ncbi:hypothetical protein [Azotobacter beijerinckii]|uniref:hypothetical protein n=1 Tax=Azotobacter beijerinckii TaxID=170623 RepID=UPI0011133DF0|nr:hypothetical protein [Azotobacter beijerinckii]